MQHAPRPMGVAHRHRLVEVEFRAQVRDDVRIRILARERERRVAGQKLLQPEDHDRHEKQGREDRSEAAREKGEHVNSF